MSFYLWNETLHHVVMRRYTDRILDFGSESEANQYIEQVTRTGAEHEGQTFICKPFNTDAWAWRERERLTEGDYTKLIWDGSPWFDERVEDLCVFGHVDEKDPSKVRYTENAKKGERDIHTSTTPGRFLKKFYGDVLTEEQIKRQVDKHKDAFVEGDSDLQWARTPEEIAAVYEMRASFTSCMQHLKINEWEDLPCHPTSVYGAGDLAIAYLTKGERLIARAVVWEEKQKVGRVYGDVIRLRNALKKYGIKTDSNLTHYDTMEGAKLLKVYYEVKRDKDIRVVLPYIDGDANNVVEDGDHLVILEPYVSDTGELVNNGQFIAQWTEGYCVSRPKCRHCNKYGSPIEVITAITRRYTNGTLSFRKEIMCEVCSKENSFFCEDTYQRYSNTQFTKSRVHYLDQHLGRCLTKEVCFETHPGRYIESCFTHNLWEINSTVELGDGSRCSYDEALTRCHVVNGKLYPIEECVKPGIPTVANDLFSEERRVA